LENVAPGLLQNNEQKDKDLFVCQQSSKPDVVRISERLVQT
jgi:hypothetical protein